MEDIPSVDFDFIKSPECEGYKTNGYVLSNNSGVTICAGFDLKAQTIQEMKKYGISSNLIQKLKPYLDADLKGEKAKQILSKFSLTLSVNEQKEINSFMIKKYENRVKYICSKNQIDYEALPKSVKTVCFSRVVHSWNITKGQIECIKNKDWKKLAQQLQKLTNYGNRGKNEAAYLRRKLKE